MTKTNIKTAADQPRRPPARKKATGAPAAALEATAPKTKLPTRADFMIGLMRTDSGETAQHLAKAVGWQVHSVRGFISGTLKKRGDLTVTATRVEGVTRYTVRDKVEAAHD